MHRKKLWVVTLVAFMVLALPASAQKGKKPKKGGGTISVTVTFRDAFLVPPLDRIGSDCSMGVGPGPSACPYIAKVEKVTTGISTRGNFFMKLTKGNQPAIRTLFLDFSDCASVPAECTAPFIDGFTIANVFTSGINLREMVIDEVRGDLRLRVAFNLGSVGLGLWNLLFDPFNADCPGSSTITVTRTGADTWVIEAGPSDVACLGELAGGGDLIFSGRYHMPFKILVQKK